MLSIAAIAKLLTEFPELEPVLDYEALVTYVDLVRILQPDLCLHKEAGESGPPEHLPISIHDFLKLSLGLKDETAKLAWAALRQIAWDPKTEDEEPWRKLGLSKYIHLFLKHGLCRGIAFHSIHPPISVCLDPQCRRSLRSDTSCLRDRDLVESLRIPVTVFTCAFGAMPGYATSRYCRNCHTRYYANYYVRKEDDEHYSRTYYTTECSLIHTSEHFFVERDLGELFATMMVTSWTSATNCAHIYNTGISNKALRESLPASWHSRLEMTVDDVWNAFFLHSLLLDHAEHETTLQLDHHAPSHLKRLQPALRARNLRTKGTGQEEWSHACDACSWHFTDEDGSERCYRSDVIDGVNMGCPCCGVHDCDDSLDSVRDRFCLEHSSLQSRCAVIGCSESIETGFKTCKSQEHRAIEVRYYERGQAMFQLKKRLERIKVTQTTNSMSLGQEDHPEGDTEELDGLEDVDYEDAEVVLDAAGEICDGKPDTGNHMLRAKFGRTRSHNEELCVASCGVIRGRARFFGSEAPNSVRWFLILLYPTKQSLPSVIWHDNNCRVTAMLRNDVEEHLRTYFDGVALPVDVFHFKSKHKVSDLDCGRNCNPYIWPELRTEDGKWRFNSSAAEQTNAWYGGFLAIVRDMQADRYEFFLDEMIKRRNRIIVGELKRKGKNPYNIPRDDLLPANAEYLI